MISPPHPPQKKVKLELTFFFGTKLDFSFGSMFPQTFWSTVRFVCTWGGGLLSIHRGGSSWRGECCSVFTAIISWSIQCVHASHVPAITALLARREIRPPGTAPTELQAMLIKAAWLEGRVLRATLGGVLASPWFLWVEFSFYCELERNH